MIQAIIAILSFPTIVIVGSVRSAFRGTSLACLSVIDYIILTVLKFGASTGEREIDR